MSSDRPSGRSPSLTERWRDIGSGQSVELDTVELWLVDLRFRRPVTTAQGVHRRRPLVLVELTGRTDTGPVSGWGECAALADTTYDSEDVEDCRRTLAERLVPALVEACAAAGGRLPRPADLGRVARAAPDRPLAFAALEMAVADAHLRAESRSLAAALAVEALLVEPGAVVGQASSIGELVGAVRTLVGTGYSRVKVKIGPGWDREPVAALRRSFPDLQIQADANGAFTEADGVALAGLDPFGLLCLEQPLDRRDLEGHARLATRLATPICLDESLDSPGTVVRALAMGACAVVCVKPARLGGLGAALQVIQSCSDTGTPLWMGGMFESGYARGVNTALAALPGFSWPGDLSPAPTYLESDLVPGPAPVPSPVPSTSGTALSVPVPQVGGMGHPPDPGIVGGRSAGRLRAGESGH